MSKNMQWRLSNPFGMILVLSLTLTVAPVFASTDVKKNQQKQNLDEIRANQPNLSQHQGRQPVAEIYRHSLLGFTLVAPPGSQIEDRGEGKPVLIRSQKGFAVNVQAGIARPDIPLNRMSALLEPRYLGEGKPWSARGPEREMRVSGMPAHEVQYTGTNARARVIVARGQKYDYVLIFMAPHHQYVKLNHEFDWVLQQFKPNALDLVPVKSVTPYISKTSNPKSVSTNILRPISPSSKFNSGLMRSQRFSELQLGYEIQYPVDWEFNKRGQTSTIFSGKKGTLAHAAIIGVQNIQPIGARNGNDAAKRAFNQMRDSIGNAVRDLTIHSDTEWIYQRDGHRLPGRQVMVSYTHDGESFRKHMIIIARPKGTVAHVWSFTAPEKQFAAFQPIASDMLSSWKILLAKVH